MTFTFPARRTPDIVQINSLTFAPFGNQNRNESGHPKTAEILGTTRQRWSAQSQKAALRAAAHLGGTTCGIRSRNLAIETLDRLKAAGLPERLCFAAAEVVRAGLGNGALRTPQQTVSALCAAITSNQGWQDRLSAAFPELAGQAKRKAKVREEQDGSGQGQSEAAAEEAAAGGRAKGPTLESLVAAAFAPKGVSYREDKEPFWPDAWPTPRSLMDLLSGGDEDTLNDLREAFRADQPLLISSFEVGWRDLFEEEITRAWSGASPSAAAAAVSAVLETRAPKGRVSSPMPRGVVDLDIALAGRMVASLPEATVEASLRIAHSMTVGAFSIEADNFTTREERPLNGNDKVGHMGHRFWGSGIHHRYALIDARKLRENLESGGRAPSEAAEIAREGIARFLWDFATVIPSGNASNSACECPASYVLIERGAAPATNLSIAFSSALPEECPDHMVEAIRRIREHKAALSRVYGSGRTAEVCAYPGADQVPASHGSLGEAIEALLIEAIA